MATETAATSTVGTGDASESAPGAAASNDQAGNSQGGSADSGAGGAGAGEGSDLTTLPDWAQKHIRDLREENAKRRTTAEQKAQEAAEKARREAMSDSEKAVEEAVAQAREELLTSFQTRLISEAAKAQLIAAGVSKPDAGALKALDLDSVTVNDKGEIEGLDAAVKTFVETYPGFVDGGGSGSGGGASRGNPGNRGGSGSTKPDPNAALREAFRRMRGGGE